MFSTQQQQQQQVLFASSGSEGNVGSEVEFLPLRTEQNRSQELTGSLGLFRGGREIKRLRRLNKITFSHSCPAVQFNIYINNLIFLNYVQVRSFPSI